MKRGVAVCFIVFLGALGCAAAPEPERDDHPIDRAEALALSEEFMTALQAKDIKGAVDKMEPKMVEALGRQAMESSMLMILDVCGRPLDRELKHEVKDTTMYIGREETARRAFYYASETTLHPKGVYFFMIEVRPSPDGLRVSGFRPITRDQRDFPEELK